MVLASARVEIAEFLSTLIYVYVIILFAYIVVNLLFAAGVRPPYSRAFDRFYSFLRDVSEPYLRIFRRFLPSFGGLDLSPILGFIVLFLVRSIVVEGLIR